MLINGWTDDKYVIYLYYGTLLGNENECSIDTNCNMMDFENIPC